MTQFLELARASIEFVADIQDVFVSGDVYEEGHVASEASDSLASVEELFGAVLVEPGYHRCRVFWANGANRLLQQLSASTALNCDGFSGR